MRTDTLSQAHIHRHWWTWKFGQSPLASDIRRKQKLSWRLSKRSRRVDRRNAEAVRYKASTQWQAKGMSQGSKFWVKRKQWSLPSLSKASWWQDGKDRGIFHSKSQQALPTSQRPYDHSPLQSRPPLPPWAVQAQVTYEFSVQEQYRDRYAWGTHRHADSEGSRASNSQRKMHGRIERTGRTQRGN